MQAMPTQDPLANLRDIHSPPAIDFWPLAPGWWAIIIISIAILTTAIYYYKRHRNNTAFKRTAMTELHQLAIDCGDDIDFIQQLNRLLKQTALAVRPRRDIASLNGEAWLHFLEANYKNSNQEFLSGPGQVLAQGPYQAERPIIDRSQLQQLVSNWIRGQQR